MSAEVERIKVTCPNCHKTLVMKAEFAGRSVTCPQCATGFISPGGQEDAPETIAGYGLETAPSPTITDQSASISKTPVEPQSKSPPSEVDAVEDRPKPKKKKKKKRSSSDGEGTNIFGPGFLRGVVFGGIASVVGAGGWALIGYLTGLEIGWLAWGVGVLCGVAVAAGCEGADLRQGFIAAGWAVFGIMFGKLMLAYFVIVPNIAMWLGMPPDAMEEALAKSGGYIGVFKSMFGPMDWLFIALAIFSAVKIGSRLWSND